LIVSSAVFYYRLKQPVRLFKDAYILFEQLLGNNVASILFGVGLVCAGQSSTVTGTMAGQIVMEGFLQMQMQPWLRRLVTRLVAIVPPIIVILVVGEAATYNLLVLSQVILSLQLPFAVVPLIKFTSNDFEMQTFVNPLWIKILAWISAAIIVGLNLYLVVISAIDFYQISEAARYSIGTIFFPIFLGILLLLGYLIFRKDNYMYPARDPTLTSLSGETIVLPDDKTIELNELGEKKAQNEADTDLESIDSVTTSSSSSNSDNNSLH